VNVRDSVSSRPGPVPEGGPTPAPNPWITLVIVCLAQFMIVLDVTVVNIAAPSIQHSLHFSSASLQWIITAYTLASGGFLLLGGRAGDLVGRRRVFLAGTLLFAAASLFNGLAPSAGALIVGRGLQGLGGAFASPAALAVLLASFPGARERTKALTVWSIVAVAGGAVGVLLGGVITSYLSWHLIFFINVPVGALIAAASVRFVPASAAARQRGGFDLPGAVTVTSGTMLLVYAITQAPAGGWDSPAALGLGLGGLALLAVFVVIEQRGASPLVRLSIFKIRALSVGNAALMLVGGATFALFLFISVYVQDILHYSALRAGLAFLPVFGGSVAGAVSAQQLVARIGIRAVSVIGLAIGAAGMLLLIDLPASGSYAASLLGQITLASVGVGMATMPLTQLATSGLAEELSGLASGVNNMAQNIGRSVGLAVLTSVEVSWAARSLHGTTPAAVLDAQVSGFHAAFLCGGILLLAGIPVVSVLRRRDTAAIDDRARDGKPKPPGPADAAPGVGRDRGAGVLGKAPVTD
jgi:EmrB/QacA subfamily drug resistance transporter